MASKRPSPKQTSPATKVTGPASYFPSIEKNYGKSIAEWKKLIRSRYPGKHMEIGSRALLQKLRETIRSVVPEVEECISYRLPAFRYRGNIIAGFSATSVGCSYYPFSGTTLKTLADAVEGYGKTKSALHFGPDEPLPVALVRQLLQARIAEGQTRRRST